MSGHTPTPWAIDEENCGDGANIRSPDGRVAWTSALRRIRTGERVIEAAEAKANAAFIVEACNSHASLLARIAELEAGLRSLVPSHRDPVGNCWCSHGRNPDYGHELQCMTARSLLSKPSPTSTEGVKP